jgi:hypothetical protein
MRICEGYSAICRPHSPNPFPKDFTHLVRAVSVLRASYLSYKCIGSLKYSNFLVYLSCIGISFQPDDFAKAQPEPLRPQVAVLCIRY